MFYFINASKMKIGFDAKRAYHNTTGLGNYSRTLIQSLAEFYPEHEYFLFNPKASSQYNFANSNLHEILPTNFKSKIFKSAWRSNWVTKDISTLKIDLYHGLSHEIPVGIKKTGSKSVVTIHDLIHERYPNQFKAIDRKIYTQKYKHACNNADKIIAISLQTKQDLIDYYHVDEKKISVCYQSCSPAFEKKASQLDKDSIIAKYNLPAKFFLYVGTINERKNLLNICKAVLAIRDELNIPLVVVGKGSTYKEKVLKFVADNNLQKDIIFLSYKAEASTIKDFLSTADLAIINQIALAMIYPSFFEGFGLPIVEALWSGLPVITSNVSCMPEVGADAAYYVNPNNANEIAAGMIKIYSDEKFANDMKECGFIQVKKFTIDKCVNSVMDVYTSIC
jgi:glycosyltransferase involved in cell wall biosynthesis